MAATSSLWFFSSIACLVMLIGCVQILENDGLKKKDWIRVGQCMLDCKQINTTCFQYCVTSAQQRSLSNYTGRTAESMWNFPKPGVKIDRDLTENNVVYPYPEPERAEPNMTSSPNLVFLFLGESPVKDIWLCKGWSTNTSMTIRHEEICDNSLLAISTQGLIVYENFNCKISDIVIELICMFIFVVTFVGCVLCLCFKSILP